MSAMLVAHIRPEATGEEGYTVPQDWPQKGEIVCQKLAVRYASDLPLVLQGVSFTAKVSLVPSLSKLCDKPDATFLARGARVYCWKNWWRKGMPPHDPE
jgi:hypothetical protein